MAEPTVGPPPTFDAWCVPVWRDAVPGPLPVEVVEPGRAGSGDPRRAGGRPAEGEPGLVVRHLAMDPEVAGRLVDRLRKSRPALLERSASEMARLLGSVGHRLLDPGDPLRRRALELLPAGSGYGPAMAEAVLDGMAADWTPSRLRALLHAELRRPEALDHFVPGARGGRLRALGPDFSLHLSSGTVPGVSVTTLIRSLLVKSPVLVKPGRGDVVLPVLFLRGLAEVEPEVAAGAAVVYWPGGSGGAEDRLLDAADTVVVYGSDDTVAAVRSRLPVTTRLVPYRHRVSLALVGSEAPPSVALDLARAVSLFDQRGCVSPHLVYVESGAGSTSETDRARRLSAELADALEALEAELPSGVVEPSEASALQQLRGTAELRAAAGSDVEIRHGGAAPWTVIYESDPAFRPSCLNRVVRVKPCGGIDDVVEQLEPMARHLQTVAVTGFAHRTEAVCERLARAGLSRITTPAGAPWPPPWWHHDGSGPLRSLLRWTDVEPGVAGPPLSGPRP